MGDVGGVWIGLFLACGVGLLSLWLLMGLSYREPDIATTFWQRSRRKECNDTVYAKKMLGLQKVCTYVLLIPSKDKMSPTVRLKQLKLTAKMVKFKNWRFISRATARDIRI